MIRYSTLSEFWEFLDKLVATSTITIDRPAGSCHPHHPQITYPLDYGYLDGTSSADGDGIDLWLGSQPENRLEAIVVIVDLQKRESEIKLLLGCTPAETETILRFHNSGLMRAEILKRPDMEKP